MFGLGGTEIGLILLVALLIIGPTQLPRLFRGLGESIREVRKAVKDVTKDDEEEKKP